MQDAISCEKVFIAMEKMLIDGAFELGQIVAQFVAKIVRANDRGFGANLGPNGLQKQFWASSEPVQTQFISPAGK